MEDIDDEFGDLYADVEVQASLRVNAIQSFTQLSIEKDDIRHNDNNVESMGDDEAKEVLNSEANAEKEMVVDNGSDSEDDLNIVLNDDGEGELGFHGTQKDVNMRNGVYEDEQFEVEENGGFVGGVGGNGLGKNRKWGVQTQGQAQIGDGLGQSLNGGDRGNGGKGGYHSQHSQYKYMRSNAAAFSNNLKSNGYEGLAFNSSMSVKGDWEDNGCNHRMGPNSIAARSGNNFSLPRSRTIYDVNIDTFERKPWRHPGADITEFFNFGFNEDNWKHYCNLLDQSRQHTIMLSRKPAYESSKHNEANEAGSEHAALPETITRSEQGKKLCPVSKISCREQQQSKVPKGRAIQVEDSICERQPSMDVRRPLRRDSDVVIQIIVQSSKEDSSGSAKEGLRRIDNSVQEAPEDGDFYVDDVRDILCFSSASEELPGEDLEGHDEGLDSPIPKRSSEEAATCPVSMDSDNQGSVQTSNVDGHDHQKMTISGSEGTSEAMETSNDKQERIGRDPSSTSQSVLETESSHGEQSRYIRISSYSGSHRKTFQDAASAQPEKSDNYQSRSLPNSVTEIRKFDASDQYPLRDSKIHGAKTRSDDCKYSARNRSPIQEDLKHCMDTDASSMFHTGGFKDVHHPTVSRGRQKERRHGFDSSYFKHSELPFNYHGDYQVGDAYTKDTHWKNHRTFGDETDQYPGRNSDEGEYFLKQRLPKIDQERIERDWYQRDREHAVQGTGPVTCEDSRGLTSGYSSYLDSERGTRWRRKGYELSFRKRIKNDDYLLKCRDADKYIQERYKRSVPYNDMDKDYSEHKYERHIPYSRREVNSPGTSRGRFDSPSVGLDKMCSVGDEDDYWRCTDHRSPSSHSYREFSTDNDRRWHGNMLPRNDEYERHGRYRRQLWSERCGDGGWFGNYANAFDTEESMNSPDERVCFGRKRLHLESEGLIWTEDEYASRYRDNKFHDEEASFPFERTSSHKGLDVRSRCKLITKRNTVNRFDRGSNIIHRSNHEETLLRCENSVDSYLVGGGGKFSGRRSKAGTVVYGDRNENMDWNIDAELKTVKNFNESRAEKVAQAENLKFETNLNGDKVFCKFPGIQRREAMDIEEGQILTEERNEDFVEKICGCEDLAHVSAVKKLHNENATHGNMVVEGYDNPRILEMMAKMEKRRERFKEPIPPKKDIDKTPKPLVESIVETAETKQQRPARKRRWGGS